MASESVVPVLLVPSAVSSGVTQFSYVHLVDVYLNDQQHV